MDVDDADGGFDAVLAGLDAVEMGEGDGEADHAVATHAEVSGVVEEDDCGGVGFVFGFEQIGADDYVRATRFAEDGATPVVVLAAELVEALGQGAVANIGKGEDAAGGLAGGVRINDLEAGWERSLRHAGLEPVYARRCWRGNGDWFPVSFLNIQHCIQ